MGLQISLISQPNVSISPFYFQTSQISLTSQTFLT